MSKTAYNCVNDSTNGSLVIAIDPEYAYPPFNISVAGPSNYQWANNGTSDLDHTLSGLGIGSYHVSVTNSVGCTALGSIEILGCSSVGGGGLPNMLLCTDQNRPDDGSGIFFLTSPSAINYGGSATDIEFRLVAAILPDPIVQVLALSKGIQSVYDIQLNGETLFDIPFQEDILDESLNLIIKFTAAGEICWVYHREQVPPSPEPPQGRLLVGEEEIVERAQAPYLLMCKAVPNPFVNALEVQLSAPADGPVTLQLFDLHGKLVQQSTVHCTGGVVVRQTLVPDIEAGIYVLKALDTSGASVAVKVIKI